ncbi:MAG: polysaccharide deacetylase family protein [Opitutaceae bacterium]|jgi:peptidoglycan/xylan/chitin deacetylase (PgdA/CDA1 family)
MSAPHGTHLKNPSPHESSSADVVGKPRVLKWKDGTRAVFMVEFDDSAPSHLEFAIPALKNRGIPGTFYINPGNGPYKSHQAAREREAASPGIELANHTFSHIGAPSVAEFDREIAEANDVIDRLYPHRPVSRLRDWARPGVPRDQWKISEAEIQDVLAKHHMIERPFFYGPPFSIKTIPEMLDWVDGTIAAGEMRHLAFHGVAGDWHSAPLDYFIGLLEKLNFCADQLWLTDPLSFHKYDTERRTARVNVLAADDASIRLSLTTASDPLFYDHPLTLAACVPPSWKHVTITQSGASQIKPVKNGEVQFDAFPVNPEIVITLSQTAS